MNIKFSPENHIPVEIYHKQAGIERYVLSEDIHFENTITSITVEKGFKLDFASVPRFLWAIFPPIDRWARAALIHDALYRSGNVTRIQADALFLTIMEHDGVPKWQRWSMYQAVRKFGAEPWRKLRGEIPREASLVDRMAFSWGMSRSWFKWAIASALILLAIFATSRCFGQQAPSYWNWTPPAEHHKSVVVVRGHIGQGVIAKGSGVYVQLGDIRGILTANHVLRDASQVSVRWLDGTITKAKHWRRDKYDLDICFIELANNREDVQALPVAAEDPQPGEMLEVVGYGSGHDRIRHYSGRFIDKRCNNNSLMDANPIQGDSGGPILRMSPVQVVGVVMAGDEQYTHFNNNGQQDPIYRGLVFVQTGRVRNFLSRVFQAVSTCPLGGCNPEQYPPQQKAPDWIYPPSQPIQQAQPLVPRQPAPQLVPIQQAQTPLVPPAATTPVCPEQKRIEKLEAELDSIRRQSEEVTANVEGVRASVQQGQQFNQEIRTWQQEANSRIDQVATETNGIRERLGQAVIGTVRTGAEAAWQARVLPFLAGGLGIGGPTGLGLVLLGRYLRRRVGSGGANQSRFRG